MMISPGKWLVARGRWRVGMGGRPGPGLPSSAVPRPSRRGITLTEILISIMILGIGLVSLATLFPIGILRLRDATRYTRSATLLQTAAADAVSRGMFDSGTFTYADSLNALLNNNSPPYWYMTPSGRYNPMTQDTAYYSYNGGDYYDQTNAVTIGANANPLVNWTAGPASLASSPGLPFAYDPLWRYQTLSTSGAYGQQGYYIGDTYEARFGYGLTTIRTDPDGNGPPSAHGLQRITNFNMPFYGNLPVMPASLFLPNVFVSQEDMVWQDPKSNTYTQNGLTATQGGIPVIGTPSLDWRYSWMFTGQLTSALNLSCFDGNIVIFENRPFGIGPSTGPYSPPGNFSGQNYMVDGETVVEGVFGYSTTVIPPGGPSGGGSVGYGSAADRSVLLRWPEGMADPVVRPGDWIADVTYERQAAVAQSRFYGFASLNPVQNPNFPFAGLQNWANKLESDNLPAQRCYWYQVQKVGTPAPDLQVSGTRSMVVFVNQNLVSRTVLNTGGTPVYLNAALIAPNVVNVIPQTIFLRGNPPSNIQ
jgi:type II secretory pathway pseudopilin PulG